MGPDRPCDDAKGQHKESHDNHLIIQVIEDALSRNESQEDAVSLLCVQGFKEVHETDTKGERKGSVAKEAGDDVADEPVALESRDEWLDVTADVGRERCVSHGQKCYGCDKGPKGPVFGPPFYDHVEKHDGPGKKDERFV